MCGSWYREKGPLTLRCKWGNSPVNDIGVLKMKPEFFYGPSICCTNALLQSYKGLVGIRQPEDAFSQAIRKLGVP